MGQWWMFVNLDKREKFESTKLGEEPDLRIHMLLAGRKFTVSTAAEYIARRQERVERRRKNHEERAARIRAEGRTPWPFTADVYRRITQRQSSFLTKLPCEVVSNCIGFADTLRDKASFALTCQDAWDIARPEIIKHLRACESWQGDRILCIGDYTRLDDVPPNVLNDEELATLRDVKAGKWQPPSAPTNGASSAITYKPTYLPEFLDARGVKRVFSPILDVTDWLREHCSDESVASGQEPYWLWSSLVRATSANEGGPGTVLRNLTTHEYIRGDAYLAARKKDVKRGSPIQYWDLADILLLRIAWAVDEDGCWEAMVGHTEAHCAWAGHRFDFIAEDKLPRDERGQVLPPWKDVSNVLTEELLRCSGW